VEEALVQYERLVQIVPEDARAQAGLIETLLRLLRYDEADARLEAALTRSPHDPRLALLDARRALRAGRIDDAERLLALLGERHDEIAATALGFRAAAELERGRPGAAVPWARRALALEPENPVATYTLAIALGALGSPEAPAWVRRARRALPSDPLLRGLASAAPPGASPPPVE
jgi:predicted Zn-dependent protease